MLLLCIANVLLTLMAASNQHLALFLFFLIGLSCGGYMVTNMVLLIEIFNHSTTRLLAVSLNGWPLGMVGTALLAYTFQHWRYFHLSISIVAFLFFLVMVIFLH